MRHLSAQNSPSVSSEEILLGNAMEARDTTGIPGKTALNRGWEIRLAAEHSMLSMPVSVATIEIYNCHIAQLRSVA